MCVWADGKDDVGGIHVQRLWGFLPNATGDSSAEIQPPVRRGQKAATCSEGESS